MLLCLDEVDPVHSQPEQVGRGCLLGSCCCHQLLNVVVPGFLQNEHFILGQVGFVLVMVIEVKSLLVVPLDVNV